MFETTSQIKIHQNPCLTSKGDLCVSFLHSNGSGRGILTVLPGPWRISQGCPIAPATSKPEDGEIEVWSFQWDLLGIIWDQDSY